MGQRKLKWSQQSSLLVSQSRDNNLVKVVAIIKFIQQITFTPSLRGIYCV